MEKIVLKIDDSHAPIVPRKSVKFKKKTGSSC